ncbi:YbfB/YjiJ family MFS transporter [Methylovirgula sp. 4M-Z18]|uniref:YbfB/YjiJ family MFS transporter n=1 Tax=Methylovirgula sp. 4M-Z18 TaxID=2293567 RepID=UPI000E2EE665|nr:YbfB/YjiJ family MFS transporter [Methylovirgula sp. 4M-Z18]RFB81322.1 YbfB/YjiJ family MFS transporter [Methylovirgula sp. 4M-Z18]
MTVARFSRHDLMIAIAGGAAFFVGNGLGRFGYPPLIPIIVAEGQVSSESAHLAGAANFFGYLLGAIIAVWLAQRLSVWRVMMAALAIATVSFFACAVPGAGAWTLEFWRFVSGVTGALLMIVAPGVIMTDMAPGLRGRAVGILFAGIGLAMALTGIALPWVGKSGSAVAWIVLGLLSALASLVAWRYMPPAGPLPSRQVQGEGSQWRGALLGLAIAYAGFGFALAVPTIFLVDYVVRGLNMSIAFGSGMWIAFGCSAAIGPLIWGQIADRVGFGLANRLCQGVMAMGLALTAATNMPTLLLGAAILIGATALPLGALASGRAGELVGLTLHARAWSVLTVLFSLFQAAAGYVCALLFSHFASYPLIFALAAAVLAGTILIEIGLSGGRAAPRRA